MIIDPAIRAAWEAKASIPRWTVDPIQVNTAPGMDEQALAEKVTVEIGGLALPFRAIPDYVPPTLAKRILRYLDASPHGDFSAPFLATELKASPASISAQLRRFFRAGKIHRYRQGRIAWYSATPSY